ncbi:MAG: HlyD family efflux transporter periplasmic adaptor subunit [Burkholderiales bacterium]
MTTSLDAPPARRPDSAPTPPSAGGGTARAVREPQLSNAAQPSNPAAPTHPAQRSVLAQPPHLAPPPRPRPGPTAGPAPAVAPTGDPLLALARALGDAEDFETAAAALCTRIAATVGAARVVLGWRTRGHPPTRAVALSGAGEPEWDGEARRLLVAAMDEAIDQARALACPPGPGQRGVLRAHALQLRAGGAKAIATVPLAHGGAAHGALLAEFERPVAPRDLERLGEAGALAAPWLRLLHERRPGALRSAWRAAGLSGRQAAARPWRARLLWAAAAAAAIGSAVPIDLTVGAPARIEGEVQRTVAAPIRGYLKAVHVRPGDAIREGDLLAELGDRDLELERAKLKSEVAQHEGGVSAAMARGERAPMSIAQARVEEARARLGLVEHQLEQIKVRAPIAGVVLQGDLWQQLGTPVDRGRTLFVVAPASRHRVIVELDERDLRRIAEGGRGRLALSALPWDTLPLVIERVAPAAATLDGRNVFELEARVEGATDALRAGQRGIAHLDVGHGPLALDWARRTGDALARLVWRWMP